MDRFVKRVLRRNEAYFGEARKRPLHAPHPPKPPLEGRWHAKRDGEVCRRAAAAARKRPSAHADALRQTFGAVTPLSQPTADSSPQGEPSLSADGAPKPPLEGRWHAKRDGEVCRRAAAAARKRPSAHADALRQTFGAVTPLSQPTADSSPQGEPSLSADGAPKPPLEGRWHAKRDGEVCRRAAAAARKRPSAHADALRQTFGAVTPLSQPTADSSPQGEPSLSADGAPKPPLEGRWHGEAVTERCAARRAAARQRLLHTPQLCGKPSVR